MRQDMTSPGHIVAHSVFKGTTTDGTVVPDLFPIQKTGVPTQTLYSFY